MKNNQFKMMYERLTANIYDNDIQCAGYLWLSLTEIQVSKIRKLAMAKGIMPDEMGIVTIGAWKLKE